MVSACLLLWCLLLFFFKSLHVVQHSASFPRFFLCSLFLPVCVLLGALSQVVLLRPFVLHWVFMIILAELSCSLPNARSKPRKVVVPLRSAFARQEALQAAQQNAHPEEAGHAGAYHYHPRAALLDLEQLRHAVAPF